MKEIRKIDSNISINEESRHVEGQDLVFKAESNDLGGFTETIDSQALTGVIERSDVLALLNHQEERGILARCNKGNGSLALTVDEKGLKYEFDAPDTALGNELLEGLKRGDISSSSFAFAIAKDKWEKRNGKYYRNILEIKALYDVIPVYRPAYNATSVTEDKRGLVQLQKLEAEKLKSEFYIVNHYIHKQYRIPLH